MPLFVSININSKWEKVDAQIIKLDRSLVQEIVELNNVVIFLSSNHRVHQCINIVILYIHEAYRLLLSRN